MARITSSLCFVSSVLGTLAACSSEPQVVVGRNFAVSRDGSTQPVNASGAPDASAPGTEEGAAVADASPSSPLDCDVPRPLHEYDFGSLGTVLPDRIGEADGEILGGARLDGTGELLLDGEDDYVRFPTGILDGSPSASFVVSVARQGGPAYVRILDFGTTSEGADPPEGSGFVGTSYVALTPGTGLPQTGLAALVSAQGSAGELALATDETLDDALRLIVLVLDAEQNSARLYVDGRLVASQTWSFALSEVVDDNNWLGRSQYDADPYFEGRYAALSLYAAPLSDCQVASLASQP